MNNLIAENSVSRMSRDAGTDAEDVFVGSELEDESLTITYVVTRSDEGRQFSCQSYQQDEYGNLLYNDSATSSGLRRVFQGPKLIPQESPDFVVHPGNATLVIERRRLEANPGPADEDAVWTIEHHASGTVWR